VFLAPEDPAWLTGEQLLAWRWPLLNRSAPIDRPFRLVSAYHTRFLFAEPSAHYLMDLTQIIGFVAGFGTTFAALPDLIAMLKRRSSAGMNPRMAAILGTFQILWLIYGTLIGSRNIIMWNVIAVVTNYLTVGAYLYFRRRETRS